MTKKDDEKVYPAVSGQTSSEMNLEAQKKGLARPSGVDNTEDVQNAKLADEVKADHATELKSVKGKATADSTEDDKALPDWNAEDPAPSTKEVFKRAQMDKTEEKQFSGSAPKDAEDSKASDSK